MPGITRVPTAESNGFLPLKDEQELDHTYVLIRRPRLPRTVVSSPQVNLNNYWEELENHYEKTDHPAVARAPTNITNEEIGDPFMVQGLSGTIPGYDPNTIKAFTLMLEQFLMQVPEK